MNIILEYNQRITKTSFKQNDCPSHDIDLSFPLTHERFLNISQNEFVSDFNFYFPLLSL